MRWLILLCFATCTSCANDYGAFRFPPENTGGSGVGQAGAPNSQ